MYLRLGHTCGGAIGIIRLSGAQAIEITDKIFTPANGKSLVDAKPNTLHYGEVKDKEGNTIDDVLVSVFKAPHSYTGENSTEISCHGSRYILQQVLQRLIEVGCRQAEPGEYTRRAFMNGKMDLSQAEAVADLIASTNKATHKMALSQLKGHFSSELARLREQLLKMTSLLELELDFSDPRGAGICRPQRVARTSRTDREPHHFPRPLLRDRQCHQARSTCSHHRTDQRGQEYTSQPSPS